MEEILQKAKEYFQSKTGFPVSKKIQLDSISVTKLMADYAEYEKIEAEKQPLSNVGGSEEVAWNDDLVFGFAEAHRFSSGRISLHQFKQMVKYNEHLHWMKYYQDWIEGKHPTIYANVEGTIEAFKEQLKKNEGEIYKTREENERLRDALQDASNQIEYLHGKFTATGSGNAVLSQIKQVLNEK